jgi:CRISPR-associated protein Cas5t
MLGLRVTVPVACFRKGLAREYLETEQLPPPSTCYGFLLSLVGETDRCRHIGCRISPVILNQPDLSVVLRTVWRVKSKSLGSSGNTRPDFQQLLTGVELVLWLDSTDESPNRPTLEQRIDGVVFKKRFADISRFGGLSLGESTHLVDDVTAFNPDVNQHGRAFVLRERGRMALPVWVDHVGSKDTNFVTGDLVEMPLSSPNRDDLPKIEPKRQMTSHS